MDNLYPNLEEAPIGGQILWHIPYSGSMMLTKHSDSVWLHEETSTAYTADAIVDDVEATWQKHGDDWNGNSFDWAKEANRLQDVINDTALLLASSDPEDWIVARKLLNDNKD